MRSIDFFRFLVCIAIPTSCFAEELISFEDSEPTVEQAPAIEDYSAKSFYWDEETKWYLEIKPGYCYLTDSTMRGLYGSGGFAIRGEIGHRLKGPFAIWLDGGYFQKDGKAIGGTEETNITLGTMTLGMKVILSRHSSFSFYAGAGPRLFMALIDNKSPYVSNDNAIGVGAGFSTGIWIAPIPQYKKLFFDLFLDYSLKTLTIDADEISSYDFDINVSGLTAGIGLGVRF